LLKNGKSEKLVIFVILNSITCLIEIKSSERNCMTEISDVQILCIVLIIALFFLVFMIIEANWAFKAGARQEQPETETIQDVPERSEAIILPEIGFKEKEIRLIPLITKPAAVAALSKDRSPSREVAFSSAVKEEEEVFVFGKTR
jgi:hypothetical protein